MLRRSQAWRGRSSARGRLRLWRGLDRSLTTSGTGGDDVAGGMHNRSSEKIEVNQLTH